MRRVDDRRSKFPELLAPERVAERHWAAKRRGGPREPYTTENKVRQSAFGQALADALRKGGR